jgi:SAM-dependent methyltransferase
MNRIHYDHCPVCHSSDIHPLMTVKDYSVTGEDFVIWQCHHCLLRFTQDVPAADSIAPYYQSAEYISHSNTSKGLVNNLYQRVRRFTLNQKAGLVISKTKGKGNLLDMGAGIGAFVHVMKEKGWEATGLEPDQGARQRARDLFSLDLQDPSHLTALKDASFDAITLWHVLEHVHTLHDYMEELKRVLRPGGTLFIAVPNYTSLESEVYKLYWAAYDVPRHLYHFSPRSMEVLLQQHGLQLTGKKPMWFDAFYISLLSSRYKNRKTSWLGAGWAGLRSNISALVNKDRCSSLIYMARKN